MPELPEVETIINNIKPFLVKKSILEVKVYINKLRWSIDQKIINLRNKLILDIKRRSKFILVQLENEWIIIHLGMSGYLSILPKFKLPEKNDHIDLIINANYMIRYTDQRRFGFWLWSKNLNDNSMLTNLGIEPLCNKFNDQWLYNNIICKKKAVIKSCLMNNKLIAGIGNIYANESLFVAGILPNRCANSLNQNESFKLVKSIKKVLHYSINMGGTTICNFLNPNGFKGNFLEKIYVYGRKNQPCKICMTKIKVLKCNQRSTFFCSKCQI